jgi:alpha-amylase/alpha-mannosidase (GH57 family)
VSALDLCFLWHMHQPDYIDPRSGRALLPWVRVHATRAYLDMAAALEAHPEVAATVNFVPSLIDQLERYVGGDIDAYEEIAARPADALTEDERELVVGRFFSVHWGRLVDPHPRYRDLLEKRGREVPAGEMRARARRFGPQDLRDLAALFELASFGFYARRTDEGIRSLVNKSKGFTEEDKAYLLRRRRELAGEVIERWKTLAQRGQVELTTSPYYHPIVPLLIDTDAAQRAMPGARLPPRFRRPDDAQEQIRRAQVKHEAVFGARASGMWPPEGSVSPEAVGLYADAGVKYLVTDEGNLFRSIGTGARESLYRPYRFDGRMDLLFRDRELSDRIGFAYAHNDARTAVDDLLGRLGAISQAAARRGEPPLVTIALDGENAWEAYPGMGEAFLHELYRRIGGGELGVRARTISQALSDRHERAALAHLHSGSWIDANFQIWINDAAKNRAWELLGALRERIARSERQNPAAVEAARDHALAAEGSDWFWWFGEPFHSAEDAIFDELFRARLAAAYRALGDAPPAELDEPIGRGGAVRVARLPRRFIHPRIDGDGRRFYEWEGAGLYVVPKGAAMGTAELLLASVRYGFDHEHLYLRLDPAGEALRELRDVELRVTLRAPGREIRAVMTIAPGAGEAQVYDVGPEEALRPLGVTVALGVGRVVDVGVPLAVIGGTPGQPIRLTIRIRRQELTLARFPREGYLEIVLPGTDFEARNWFV